MGNSSWGSETGWRGAAGLDDKSYYQPVAWTGYVGAGPVGPASERYRICQQHYKIHLLEDEISRDLHSKVTSILRHLWKAKFRGKLILLLTHDEQIRRYDFAPVRYV